MKEQSEAIKKFLDKEIDPAFARRARIILENLDMKGKEKILEVGCGRGFYEAAVLAIYPDVHIVGIDLNEEYLAVAKKSVRSNNATFLRADATKLPFKNGEFDRIICTEVLEHIKDDEKVISEIYRVLKPGGIALITVPNKNYPFFWDPINYTLERLFNWHIPSNIWWLAGIWADHVRLYSKEDLLEKLGESGFRTDRIWRSTHYCLPFSHFLLYGIGKNLVEAGLSKSFDRFSFETKPTFFVKLIKRILFIRDHKNVERISYESFLNIIIKVKK